LNLCCSAFGIGKVTTGLDSLGFDFLITTLEPFLQ
jgi:hypothetical protein